MLLNSPPVVQLVNAQPVSDGAGVHIRRGIGTPLLRHLDPFLMIDHFGSDDPDDYLAGFPDHPHRGFITLTYMIDGNMQHRDSMGNEGNLGPGAVQWMKAASGVIHSEMPQQDEGLMRGFQLWINLPAKEKMSDPAYQEFCAHSVPVAQSSGCQVKVIAGPYQTVQGPVVDARTELSFFDVELSTGRFNDIQQLASSCFVYVFDGVIAVHGTHESCEVHEHAVAVIDPRCATYITAVSERARFVLVAGQPIEEPVVQHGPFVMNTEQEIEQAIRDYQMGRLVLKKATVTDSRSDA